ncbi:hypothetical protein SAMN05421664_3022 [Chryseobacterium soldanellicola]|uniref:PRTase-CE domain-containing protein n=1 Tax=Chryseobacterium soldanellicola TaxID=311333 RepID=A0A1H1FDX7_9FLAO|nr:hypothetical protein [Chryseobacterium soldanellicola]SDQ99333.1 hypothetical protein SAMN05421664_3022 [Chryseobacterium soldanellicola]
MRTALAERLLIEIMQWDNTQIRVERPLLQSLSTFKYNEYQQFSIGTRFIESLVKWLKQFETLSEREIAYTFLKDKLIFISNDQMLHLVNTTFSDKINPFLISKTATKLNISPYLKKRIVDSDEYNELMRTSLFIGLSDGSRIDQLRRYCGLDNEQVIPTYQINEDKVTDMLKELHKKYPNSAYNTIFLVDDFTASGTSYFRIEADNSYKGKIFKTLRDIFQPKHDSHLHKLIDMTTRIDVRIIFYIATEEAIDKLNAEILKWRDENNFNFNYKIEVIQTIENDVKIDQIKDKEFYELSEKYVTSDIIDEHFVKAKHEKHFLGYNECALPLILVHNTPNNSLPLLWWTKKNRIGLFPRVTRHK